jgi:hypothetical protein
VPHMYCRCLARAGRGRLLVSIGHIARTCAFQQLDVAITHELPQIMHSSVNMPRALPISGIFAHHDTRGIILDLSEIETPQ